MRSFHPQSARFRPSAALAADLLQVLATLASPHRLRVVATLAAQRNYVSQLARELSDMAITAQEHVDLRLTDLGVQVDSFRDRLDQMRRILKEVE